MTSSLPRITIADRIMNMLLSDLANAFPYIMWITDKDGTVDYYNRHWFKYTGLNLEQARTLGWHYIMHPEDLGATIECWQKHCQSGQLYEYTHRIRRYDGVFRTHASQAFPVRDHNGDVMKWFGSSIDIEDHAPNGTPRKVRNEKLQLQLQLSLLEKINANVAQHIDEHKSLNENLRMIKSLSNTILASLGLNYSAS